MKRKALITTALLSAGVLLGSTPLTSYAAEAWTALSPADSCYQVYIGQGAESLSQLLQELNTAFENGGSICPDTGRLGEDIPEISVPELPMPETPEQEAPAPGVPNPPTEEKPDGVEPDVEKPGEDTADEAILSYAEQVVKLVNEERAKAGLPALELKTDITSAANVRAKEIKQKFSHTRPDGSSFSSVLREQGVSFRGSGENIAWGQKSPEQVMNAWMNSDGHRANILNKNFKNIGVGHYVYANGVNYWVQLFTY